MCVWTSQDVAATQALGRALARVAPDRGLVVALVGDLGAGKTAFAQGVGQGLEVGVPIVSPTFVLVAEYEGTRPLLHADVYRIEEQDLPGVGLEELLETWPGVALVEWADRFVDILPDDHLVVRLEVEEDQRLLSVEATGPAAAAALAAWRDEVEHGG